MGAGEEEELLAFLGANVGQPWREVAEKAEAEAVDEVYMRMKGHLTRAKR